MKENGVLGLLIISNSSWTLIANNKRLPQKSLVLTTLFLVAISGIMLFNGAGINMINNINQAQAQGQTDTRAATRRANKVQQNMGNTR